MNKKKFIMKEYGYLNYKFIRFKFTMQTQKRRWRRWTKNKKETFHSLYSLIFQAFFPWKKKSFIFSHSNKWTSHQNQFLFFSPLSMSAQCHAYQFYVAAAKSCYVWVCARSLNCSKIKYWSNHLSESAIWRMKRKNNHTHKPNKNRFRYRMKTMQKMFKSFLLFFFFIFGAGKEKKFYCNRKAKTMQFFFNSCCLRSPSLSFILLFLDDDETKKKKNNRVHRFSQQLIHISFSTFSIAIKIKNFVFTGKRTIP